MTAKTIDVPDLVIRRPVPCSNCPGVASYQYTDHWMCQDCGSTWDEDGTNGVRLVIRDYA